MNLNVPELLPTPTEGPFCTNPRNPGKTKNQQDNKKLEKQKKTNRKEVGKPRELRQQQPKTKHPKLKLTCNFFFLSLTG